MKKLRKALVCVALLCCLSVSVLGCNSTTDDDSNNQTDANASVSDNVGDAQANAENQETDEQGNVVTNADNTSNDSNTPQETVALTDASGNVVTDENGNVVTQIVVDNGDDNSNNNGSTTTASGGQTTDKQGNTVTDEQGNPVTNAGVTVTDDGGNSSNSGNDDNQNLYFAKNRYSTFLWMSEDTSNKCESGVVVEVAVKVLDDAQSGEYPIEFNYVELYDTNNNEVPFTVQNGTVTVGQASSVSEQGAASSGVNYRLDNATAQPGDVVKLKVHLDNNTGIAVTRVELKYDNKALEVQSISSSGAFADQIVESGKLNSDSSIRQ